MIILGNHTKQPTVYGSVGINKAYCTDYCTDGGSNLINFSRDIVEYAREYIRMGLCVIPLRPRSKEPLIPWREFQKRRPTLEEAEKWFVNTLNNLAILCGTISGNLIVFDIESLKKYEEVRRKIEEKLGEDIARIIFDTWVVGTGGGGVHVYLKVIASPELFKEYFRTKIRLIDGVDVKGEGGYVVAPPSIHPNGEEYRFVYRPPSGDIAVVHHTVLAEILEALSPARIKEIEGLKKPIGGRRGEEKPTIGRRLSEDQIKHVVSLIEPYYVKGYRDLIIYALLGLLAKTGVDYDSAHRIVELLAMQAKDEEANQRLYLVDYHYGRRVNVVGIERLKGVSGLREEFEKVLRGQGIPEEEVVRRISETITELYITLGIGRGPGVAWLERRGGRVRKWVAVGRHGIYMFKRVKDGEEPTIQIVSNAVISDVRGVKILGLGLRNLYWARINGEEISGTVEEIAEYIEEHHGLERGSKYAVARLIEFMAEEEKELFYSPGPWVVDGKIQLAGEPGYTPPWKEYRVWRIPEGDVDVELKRKALKSIRNLVLAYRDPSKASLVLCYNATTPIAHYIKVVLGIVFHMIVHGLEESGKSLLLDLVKSLYNITWDETFPGSDYQARKMLAESSLPAVIDELTELINAYAQNKKEAIDAINVLHRAATQETLKVSGGYQYGGHFLAVRALVGATNTDITIVPWQADKFILVQISGREGVRIEKARGHTPRTMSGDVKRVLPYIGIELLKEVEGLIGEIGELRYLPRSEIREKLVEIGYKAWRRLYEKYGLEPFPQPSKTETEEGKTGVREQYRDMLISYVRKCMEGDKSVECIIKAFNDAEENVEALNMLEKELAIVSVKPNGTLELLCKTSFITKFSKYAEHYGLIGMGWRRLAEILGFKKPTKRRIGGKMVNNILGLKLF